MAHLVALPDVNALGGRFIQNAPGFHLSLVRSSERNYQLHCGNPDRAMRRGLDDVARTPQNAVDFAKSSKTVAVVFSNRVRFFNRNVIHDGCPEPQAATLDHFQIRFDCKLNRFRAAPLDIDSKALVGTGVRQ